MKHPPATHPPSKSFILSIRLCLALSAVAHLFAAIFFQRDLATSWEGMIPHLCLALLSVVGAISGTHGAVLFGRRGEFLPLACCVAVLVFSAGLTALSATGFYSAESRKAGKAEQAQGTIATLDAEHVASLKSQINAIQGQSGGREGSNPRLIQLRQQRAELVTQREAYTAKNMITAGVKPTEAKITAVDAEIANEQAATLAVAGASSKANSGRLESLQTELSNAISTAKQEVKAAPSKVSAADALFESLGHNWNMPAETVRAKFLFWQPIVLEVLSILLSLISACLTHGGLAASTTEDQYKAPMPLQKAAAAAADGHTQVIPLPSPPEPPRLTKPVPVPRTGTPDAATGEGIASYVDAIFADWTPTDPRLRGKNVTAIVLGLDRRQSQVHHTKARTSPHYTTDRQNQPWAFKDSPPATKSEAIQQFTASLS